MTLRTRLAVAATVLLSAITLGGWFVMRIDANQQRQQVDKRMESVVGSALRLVTGGPPGAPSAGPQLRPIGDSTTDPNSPFSDVYVARLLADGTREVLLRRAGADPEPKVPAISPPDARTWKISTVGSVAGDQRWRAVALTPPSADEHLLVAVSLASADATAERLRLAVLIVGGVMVLALTAAGWWIVRLGLRPIAEVASAADAIAAGDRQTRVSVRARGTEAAHLAAAFNVMLDERQADEDRLRTFVSDASHELRTPVAAVRGFTDLYRSGGLSTPQQLDDAMRRIGAEGARMSGLVDDLLLLARLDEGRPLDRRSVDLGAVLTDAAFDAGATHPSRVVTAAVDGPLHTVGDEARLRQVVSNLVMNALSHGGDSDVTISGRVESEHCVVEVSDRGPGMSADDRLHAFDRFWRGDTSRVRQATGSGLGLSIVSAIVTAHGGRATIVGGPGEGTTVRLVLPEAGAAMVE